MGEVVMSCEEGIVGVEDTNKNKDGSSEVVRWEKFLPRMALRVLLVEADDSTRQIIAALLRKCSYSVAAVPDGLMAWETLKSRPHNIDLILTEVELPSISGYALLTLVMEHDICKNIPVIMMSSHDSISMVLKCMLKGAADFLIKPVRRNELRNLWHHVWRRQTLTSGHIPQNSHKVEATSENNADSNHSSDCATSLQKHKECSEKGSGAQSSCTTPYLEAESVDMQNVPGLSPLNYKSASNVSNMDRAKYEACVKLDKRSVTPESKTRERSNSLEPEGGPCSETYYPTALRLGVEHICPKKVFQHMNVRSDNDGGYANMKNGPKDALVKPSSGAIDLIGTFDNGPKFTHGHFGLNDGKNKFEFTPQLELSLRRFNPNSSKIQGVDDRHALNHSNASAFSLYNSKTLQPFFPMSTSNCTEFKEEASKSTDLSTNQNPQNTSGLPKLNGSTLSGSQETETPLVICQSGKTELVYQKPQIGLRPASGVRLDNISSGYGHVSPPVYCTQPDLPSTWSPNLTSQQDQSPFPTCTSVHSNPEIYDSENNYRHSDETANNSVVQNAHQQENIEFVEERMHGSTTPGQSTSSSLCNGVSNHNNGSTCGSICNRNDGNSTSVVVAEKTVALETLNDSGPFIHDRFRGIDYHRSSQREAALTKFRLKRKDRCYEKKVRYQSRKRLAEQRPRVKGQFVRQVQNDVPMADANA